MIELQNRKFIVQYLALRNEIDSACKELNQMHNEHLQCKQFCSGCCMNFSIFPIEFYAIKEKIEIKPKEFGKPESEEACPFLLNQICTIYENRPIICRTQGLPLLFTGDEGWELSACELNFKDFDFSEFNFENTFPQDKFNSKLYLINKEFIDSVPEKQYGTLTLIELRNLVD